MNTFEELNNLLLSDENQYYENDYFLDAEILIAKLSETDLPQLLIAWQHHNAEWWSRFSQSASHIQQSILRRFLSSALTTRHKAKTVLSLMNHLPAEADRSELSQSLVNYTEKLWHTDPGLHLQIQMSTWQCGLSARLLNKLGFSSWREAGL